MKKTLLAILPFGLIMFVCSCTLANRLSSDNQRVSEKALKTYRAIKAEDQNKVVEELSGRLQFDDTVKALAASRGLCRVDNVGDEWVQMLIYKFFEVGKWSYGSEQSSARQPLIAQNIACALKKNKHAKIGSLALKALQTNCENHLDNRALYRNIEPCLIMVDVLGEAGQNAEGAVPWLAARINTWFYDGFGEVSLAEHAAAALAKLGVNAKSVVGELELGLLKYPEAEKYARVALQGIVPEKLAEIDNKKNEEIAKEKQCAVRQEKVLIKAGNTLQEKYPSSALWRIIESGGQSAYGLAFYTPAWYKEYQRGCLGKILFGGKLSGTGQFYEFVDWNVDIETGKISPGNTARGWIEVGLIRP